MNLEKFLEIVNAAPLISIDFVIRSDCGKILLGKRTNRPAQGFWFVPGGRIFKEETIDEAIGRISLKEIGHKLTKQSSKFKGVFEHFYCDNFAGVHGVSTHYIVLAYEFVLENDIRLKTDDQHSDLKWWDVDQLLLGPQVHYYTKSYVQNQTKPQIEF